MYLLCWTWLADSPLWRKRGGGSSQLCSFIASILLAQPPLSFTEPTTYKLRDGVVAADLWTSAVPPHLSPMLFHTTPPLRTGHSLPALYPQKLEFPLKNLLLRELKRDVGEMSHKKVEGIRHNPERVENYLESTWLFSPTSSSLVLEATQLSNGNFRHPWASEATFSTLK